MRFMRRAVLFVSVVLFLGVGSVRGQEVDGYVYTTGIDSTLWEDMSKNILTVPLLLIWVSIFIFVEHTIPRFLLTVGVLFTLTVCLE